MPYRCLKCQLEVETYDFVPSNCSASSDSRHNWEEYSTVRKGSLLAKLQGPTEEEVFKYFEGRPNDLLMKSCEDFFYNGIIKAFELGASLEDRLKKGTNIFLRLLMQLNPGQIRQLHTYVYDESAPPLPEMTSAYFSALFALASNGLDLKKLLDDYYIFFFDTHFAESVFLFDTKSLFQSDHFRIFLECFEPAKPELQAKALYAAAKNGNIIGINYLIETGADIQSNHKALFIAILNRDAITAELLLESGADLYSTLDYYYTRATTNKLIKNRKISANVKEIIYKHVQQQGLIDHFYSNAKKYENRLFMEVFSKR